MYLVREVYNARRGKASQIIEGFQAINSYFASQGNTSGRIFADYAGRMDTIVHQIEVESLDEYYKFERSVYEKPPPERDPQFQALIDKFNDNSVAGYREIWEVLPG